MLHWARAWRVPRGKLGASSPRCSAVPVAFSSSRSSGQGNADPRPLPLSYNLLDGETTLPAIVFLHGLFGSKTNFNSIAKAMVQRTGRRVLTVDARNHGDSPHSPDASYEAMSQDLQGLLPQLGLVPCVVVGHSMGGKTAMLLALQRVSCIYLGLPHPALPTLRALLIMWDTSAPWMARLQQLCWSQVSVSGTFSFFILSSSQMWWSDWSLWT